MLPSLSVIRGDSERFGPLPEGYVGVVVDCIRHSILLCERSGVPVPDDLRAYAGDQQKPPALALVRGDDGA